MSAGRRRGAEYEAWLAAKRAEVERDADLPPEERLTARS